MITKKIVDLNEYEVKMTLLRKGENITSAATASGWSEEYLESVTKRAPAVLINVSGGADGILRRKDVRRLIKILQKIDAEM